MTPGLVKRSDRTARFLGAVVAGREGYDVVRHPDQPRFWFGNCVALHAVPEPGSLSRWRTVWDRELGPLPGLERMVLTAESTAGEVPAGLAEEAHAEGLELEVDDVLVLGTLLPHPPPDGVMLRPVTVEEWPLVVDIHVTDAADDGREDFERWAMCEYARLLERGRGRWWAAWRDDLPVASAGLFRGDGLGRYQNVVTHPAHRRQGLATALIAAMAASHLAQAPGDPLVIVAKRDSSPARLYRRVGFTLAATALSFIGPVPPH